MMIAAAAATTAPARIAAQETAEADEASPASLSGAAVLDNSRGDSHGIRSPS